MRLFAVGMLLASESATAAPAELSLPVGGGDAPFVGGLPTTITDDWPKSLKKAVVSLAVDGRPVKVRTPATTLPTGLKVSVDADTGWATLTPAEGDAFEVSALGQALSVLRIDPFDAYRSGTATIRLTDASGDTTEQRVVLAPAPAPCVLELGADVSAEAAANGGKVELELARVKCVAERFDLTRPLVATSSFSDLSFSPPDDQPVVEQAMLEEVDTPTVTLPVPDVPAEPQVPEPRTDLPVPAGPYPVSGTRSVTIQLRKEATAGGDSRKTGPSDGIETLDKVSSYRAPTAGQYFVVSGTGRDGQPRSEVVHVVPAVQAAVDSERLSPRLVGNNAGSTRTLYAFAHEERLRNATVAWKRKNDACNTSLNPSGYAHGLTCDRVQIRMDLDGELGQWFPLTEEKTSAGSLVELLDRLGDGIPLAEAEGYVTQKEIQAQFWAAQVGAPEIPGSPGHLVGEKPIGGPTLLTVGWENRNRFTFSAFTAPAAVGVTALRCATDVIGKGGETAPFGEEGSLFRGCAETGNEWVGTTSVALSPAGARLRFAPAFEGETFGMFVDARFLEFGTSGFTNPGPENDATGLLSAGSMGAGADAMFSIGDQEYWFLLRGAASAVLVNNAVHVRPLVELGVAIPILSTGQGGDGKEEP